VEPRLETLACQNGYHAKCKGLVVNWMIGVQHAACECSCHHRREVKGDSN